MSGLANTTNNATAPTPLGSLLFVTFLSSLGTGVFWNAIGFVAKHAYDFSQERTLVLYLVMGLVYTFGATQAGRLTRWSHRLTSPRGLLAAVIGVQVVMCLAPVTFTGEWALWTSVVGVSVTAAVMWPIMESYLTSGRHGPQMRSAIGWFNLTWMTAVALPLLVMPPILEHHAQWAVGGQAVANLIALVPLIWFTREPGHHDPDVGAANVGGEYPLLLQCARVMLATSYMLNAALSPILPYRFEAIGASVEWETPTTATWMLVRVLALLVMWRAAFWHGRWGTLLLGGAAMTVGFGVLVLAPSMTVMLAGFALFGVGMGVSYYTALYYAMSVGHGEVDAGGTHEALIGGGYSVGPVAGLVGVALGGGAAIVGIVWGVVGVGAAIGMMPYRAARRRRRAG